MMKFSLDKKWKKAVGTMVLVGGMTGITDYGVKKMPTRENEAFQAQIEAMLQENFSQKQQIEQHLNEPVATLVAHDATTNTMKTFHIPSRFVTNYYPEKGGPEIFMDHVRNGQLFWEMAYSKTFSIDTETGKFLNSTQYVIGRDTSDKYHDADDYGVFQRADGENNYTKMENLRIVGIEMENEKKFFPTWLLYAGEKIFSPSLDNTIDNVKNRVSTIQIEGIKSE